MLLFSWFVALAHATPVPAAEAVVRALYSAPARPGPLPAATQSLQALERAAQAVVPGPLAWDPLREAAGEGAGLTLTSTATALGARVTVQRDGGPAVTYTLIQEGGAWRVDEVFAAGPGSLRTQWEARAAAAPPPQAVAQGVPAAEAVVRALYQPILDTPADAPSPPSIYHHPGPTLSASLRALLREVDAATVPGGDLSPYLCCDPIVDAQDWNMDKVTYASAPTPAGATVQATFLSGTEMTTVTYTLIREGRAWRVDDINGPEQGSLRLALTRTLDDQRAAPDPRVVAVEAAVAAHCAPYAARTAPPLHAAPALTKGLRAQLQAAVAQLVQTGQLPAALTDDPFAGAAEGPPPEIDTHFEGSKAVVELAWGGSTGHRLTLRLLEEDGAWRIDDLVAGDGPSLRDQLRAP